jgi:hypothetical protein
MKKILLGAGLSVMMFACTTEIPVDDIQVKPDKTESIVDNSESVTSENVELEEEVLAVELKKFTGNFFSVMHPENFTPSPDGPVVSFEGVSSIDTDEAYFYAPDSSVVFFVYGPQWSGRPENYLTKRTNEKAGSTDKKESTDGLYTTVIESGSFSDKDGKYQRAYVSTTSILDGDSETKKVFGIQYVNQESYDKYRETYKAFKKSLKQFAD